MKQAPRRRKRPIPTWTPLANLRPNRLQERGAQSPQSRKALETRAYSGVFGRTGVGGAEPSKPKGTGDFAAATAPPDAAIAWAQSPQSRKALETGAHSPQPPSHSAGRRALKAERHWRRLLCAGGFRCRAFWAQSPQSRKALETDLANANNLAPDHGGAEPSKPKGTGDV